MVEEEEKDMHVPEVMELEMEEEEEEERERERENKMMKDKGCKVEHFSES